MLVGTVRHETSNIIEETVSTYNIFKGRIFEEVNKGTACALGSPLSSAEACLCCRKAGEKESARGMMRSPRAFYFSVIAIFIVILRGSLCGGERIQNSKNQHLAVN